LFWLNEISRHDRPMPRKNTNIMLRRPHWSPSLPDTIEPAPNMKDAPKA